MEKITKILVELNGSEPVDITDLQPAEYEQFLELTNHIRTAYNVIKNSKTETV